MGSVDSSTNAAGAYATNVWAGLAVSGHNANFGERSGLQQFRHHHDFHVDQRRSHLAGHAQPHAVGDVNVPGTSGTNTIQIPIGSGTSFSAGSLSRCIG